MEEGLKVVGKIVICTVKVNIHGRMGDFMKEIISMTKKYINLFRITEKNENNNN